MVRLAKANEADRVELGNDVVVQLPGEQGQRHPLRCLDDVACSHAGSLRLGVFLDVFSMG